MANKNNELRKANKAKNDEFYTQLSDIEKELKNYRKEFKDKVVFCTCDDPYESNFFKYFAMNFNFLGLKKLISTCYSTSPMAFTQLSLFDVNGLKNPPNDSGLDRFRFIISKNGIEPEGYNASSAGIMFSGTSEYNTAWVIKTGNMDYLRCADSLDWSTKRTCD